MSNDTPGDRKEPKDITRALDLGETTQRHWPIEEDFEFDFASDPQPESTLPRERRAPVLGDYIILDRLGAGGMGQVYRARHRTMDREVAVKVLPRRFSSDAHAVDRFYAEVRAQGRMMHPNIVTAFDAGCHRTRTNSVHFLVMELIQGESLAQRVAIQGPMSGSDAIKVIEQAAVALEYAHSLGIVHRDIKPGNMMLNHQGVLKILDFGLAVLRDLGGSHEVGKSQIIGTVEYMSPEQINTPDLVDERTDLYSLGATLFYLLIGRPMFTGEVMQTALAQLRRAPPALYELRSDLDLRLDSIFQWLVAKDVVDRCPSAHHLLEKLYELRLLERPGHSLLGRKLDSREGMSRERPTSIGQGTSTSRKSFGPFGIDLGMIHSRSSYVNHEFKIEQVPLEGELLELRNMVYSDQGSVRIGSAAADQRVQHPEQIFYGIQRWYGLPMLEKPFGGRRVPPEVLVASILRQIIMQTRSKYPSASHAVVTVPSCYDQMHRHSTKIACSIAGLEVLQLLDKPLAAALAHCEIEARLAQARGDTDYQKNILVVMLSGSACEASVVQSTTTRVQTLGSVGDCRRGTVRWHDMATKRLAGMIEKQHGISARDNLGLASQLQRTMERAFERLRHSAKVPFIIELSKGKFEGCVERDRVSDWVDDLVDDCELFAKEAIARARVDAQQIETLIVIGDIRWLPTMLSRITALVHPKAKVIPMGSTDMARGAAVQARHLMPPLDAKNPVAFGASSYDFGLIIQERDGNVHPPKVLIPKDTTCGHSISRTLRFSREGKQQPLLQFIEGTRFGNLHWNRLASIDLQNCFEGRVHADPLQLTMETDANGMLNSSITWLAGNKQLSLPPLGIPTMDAISMRHWRDWLESLMLCST
ncbi:MAG: Hsp70 family protein [Planctomycetota bacterium]|nr:Hsp70 family protein [Planctomycetota bacterium]